MLGRVWEFVKRHRRKFVFAGVVIGGGILIKNYARKKIRDWEEKQMAECLETMRREQYFESMQRTCNSTVLSFVGNMRDQIIRCLDSDSLTSLLKTKPQNRVKIWEDLKLVAFSRAMSLTYSSALLILLLRVKLSILGGYMYSDILKKSNDADSQSSSFPLELQHKYLENVQYLLTSGIQTVVNYVQKAVRQEIEQLSLKERLSLSDLENLIKKIRQGLESEEAGNSRLPVDISCLLLPTEECGLSEATGGLLLSEDKLHIIMSETRDVLESNDCRVIFNQLLDNGFSQLVDCFAEYFVGAQDEASSGDAFQNPNEVTIAVAKLIPLANGMVHGICSDEPSQLIQHMLAESSLKTWSANIYEAFVSHVDASDRNHNARS